MVREHTYIPNFTLRVELSSGSEIDKVARAANVDQLALSRAGLLLESGYNGRHNIRSE